MTRQLTPGGVFALWSNDRPDPAFTDRLAGAFGAARAAEEVSNPLLGRDEVQTVYLPAACPRRLVTGADPPILIL